MVKPLSDKIDDPPLPLFGYSMTQPQHPRSSRPIPIASPDGVAKPVKVWASPGLAPDEKILTLGYAPSTTIRQPPPVDPLVERFLATSDPGPFKRIASRFFVNRSDWSGLVIASPRAMYLITAAKVNDLFSCCGLDLPASFRQAAGLPEAHDRSNVIILPAQAVGRVDIGRINNWMTVSAAKDSFNITLTVFSNLSIRRFLRRAGWTLNQPLTPTAPALHSIAAYARQPEAPVRQTVRSFRWTRFVMLLLLGLFAAGVVTGLSVQAFEAISNWMR